MGSPPSGSSPQGVARLRSYRTPAFEPRLREPRNPPEHGRHGSGERPGDPGRTTYERPLTSRGSELEVLEILAEFRPQLGPLEGELDGRLEPAHRGSRVVAGSLELIAVDRLLFHQRLDRVRELDLASRALLRLLELVEDLRRQDVATDDREVRGSLGRLR